ncbi:MAG: SDR family NAD(P)-dependent oxidoreductase, partial [Acidimicrobiia bacterium]
MTNTDLTGKVAVVTGGGAGIGRGIAVQLATHGADVAVIDIDPDRAAQAVAAVEALG